MVQVLLTKDEFLVLLDSILVYIHDKQQLRLLLGYSQLILPMSPVDQYAEIVLCRVSESLTTFLSWLTRCTGRVKLKLSSGIIT